MTTAINRDDVRDIFHECVLEALDRAATRAFVTATEKQGWKDEDLPQLFKAVDAQIERIAERLDVALLDPVIR